MTQPWKFDTTVAKTFVSHARQHIPNYDIVIDKCVSMCEWYLEESSRIVDVGCATGETVRRLYSAGFDNLTGVESSSAMLNHCDHDIARFIHSDRFPNETFDAVLCNWTLHFIEDKETYLIDIHRNMHPDGFLILSEKTSLDPTSINHYHSWKLAQGVTIEEVTAKEAAIKDVMFIRDPKWYLDTLTWIGFKNIQIIDASWCFTTFMCYK
jgi:ubiquinone/menaquinone biosynthesis C-methylase UbiE